MPPRDREEDTEVGCCRDEGTYGEGILGVWDTTDSGIFVPVPEIKVVRQQQLACGGTEPPEGAGKMVTAGKDLGKEGNRRENGGEILCGGGAIGAPVWVRYVVSDPLAGEIT